MTCSVFTFVLDFRKKVNNYVLYRRFLWQKTGDNSKKKNFCVIWLKQFTVVFQYEKVLKLVSRLNFMHYNNTFIKYMLI